MNRKDNELIQKLNSFIRKYYINELLRGGLLFLALFVSTFLLIIILEYFSYFDVVLKTVLFYGFWVVTTLILFYFIVRPILKLFRLAGGISHKDAAIIIGRHFPDVADSLLNALQLKDIAQKYSFDNKLLLAAIEQKVRKLSPVPFNIAINFRSSIRYLRYSLPPLLILFTLLSANPGVIREPATRMLNHGVYYEKPAPFEFIIENQKLETTQNQDFRLDVKTRGEILPEQAWLIIGENEFLMNQSGKNKFSFLFRTPQLDMRFYIRADEYKSRAYTLKVLPKPSISSFGIDLAYPVYTGRGKESMENIGDLLVPEGTKITWTFYTRNTEQLSLRIGEKLFQANSKNNQFIATANAKISGIYSVYTHNRHVASGDSLQYTLHSIPDAYPSIELEAYKDSSDVRRLYFNGMIRDDYGFSRLDFIYRFVKTGTSPETLHKVSIPVGKTLTVQQFFHFFDISSISIQPGEEIVYYFEVHDNDGVNGPKPARSTYMHYKAPDQREINEMVEKQGEEIQQQLSENLFTINQLQQQIDEIGRKLVEKKSLSWEDRQQIKDLLKRQQQIEKSLEDISRKSLEKSRTEQHFKELSPELLEKQKMLEKLFNELMTEEMKELFRQLEQMIDQAEKDKLSEMMEQMKLTNEDIEKELDRSLELFKQLEFEKKLTDAINKLENLKNEQDKLREMMEETKSQIKEQTDQQDKLNKEFEDIRKDLDELKQTSLELDLPSPIPDTRLKEEAIKQSMENSRQNMQKGRRNDASESQQKTSEQLEELRDEIENYLDQMEDQQAGEDIATLRKILENLVRTSFRQENLMKQFGVTSRQDPRFPTLIEQQKLIARDLKTIEDSLFALSKRQIQLESFVNQQINDINYNIDKALKALIDMNTVGMVSGNVVDEARRRQQHVMTSVNNLGLMLAESLKNMQEQQNSKKQGKSCKKGKPGKSGDSKPSAATMRKLQEQLNKQMQQMKEQLEKGGKSPGGQPGMSEQLARMAAQQEAIRKMMQQYREEILKQDGGDKGNLSKIMKEMEKTETDLVNKMINQETLKRQEEILTRLLESEKAEREQEFEEKRESTESKNLYFSNPKEFLEYKRLKTQEEEILRTIPAGLKPFYKNKVNEYFYTID